MKPLGFTLDDMRMLLEAQDTLAPPEAMPDVRAAASATPGDFHTRAEQACATIARQPDYARELTDRLAGYAVDPSPGVSEDHDPF